MQGVVRMRIFKWQVNGAQFPMYKERLVL